MSAEQLKSLDSNVIELGLHSFRHCPYDNMIKEAVDTGFQSVMILKAQIEHQKIFWPVIWKISKKKSKNQVSLISICS